MARYGVYTGAAGSLHPLDGKETMTTIEAVERLNGLTAAVEQLTAQRDALAAACRGMVEQCPVCGGEGDGTWMVQGKSFPCPYCHSARAALGLVTAGEEERNE